MKQIDNLVSFSQKRWHYHALFWFIYSGFWHFVYSSEPFTFFSLVISSVYFFCNVCPAYINIYGLIPRWLYPKKIFIYLVALFVNVLFFTGLLGSILTYLLDLTLLALVGTTFASVFTSVLIVSGIKLVKQQLIMQRQQQTSEKAALANELKFLKSQLNPHFMFNALNNIYFLIKKDPDMAAEVLSKYSDILRYQIYDCNEKYIPLKEEIDFLENYINISQLRKNRLELKLDLAQNLNGEQIAPLMLVPFVENAFKHVSDEKDQANLIEICIKVLDNNEVAKSNN